MKTTEPEGGAVVAHDLTDTQGQLSRVRTNHTSLGCDVASDLSNDIWARGSNP